VPSRFLFAPEHTTTATVGALFLFATSWLCTSFANTFTAKMPTIVDILRSSANPVLLRGLDDTQFVSLGLHVVPALASLIFAVSAYFRWRTRALKALDCAAKERRGWRTAVFIELSGILFLLGAVVLTNWTYIDVVTTPGFFSSNVVFAVERVVSILLLIAAGSWQSLGGTKWAFAAVARRFERRRMLDDGAKLAALVLKAPPVDWVSKTRWVKRAHALDVEAFRADAEAGAVDLGPAVAAVGAGEPRDGGMAPAIWPGAKNNGVSKSEAEPIVPAVRAG
jgi:hypothetical protein